MKTKVIIIHVRLYMAKDVAKTVFPLTAFSLFACMLTDLIERQMVSSKSGSPVTESMQHLKRLSGAVLAPHRSYVSSEHNENNEGKKHHRSVLTEHFLILLD